jgi:hypothetical protein
MLLDNAHEHALFDVFACCSVHGVKVHVTCQTSHLTCQMFSFVVTLNVSIPLTMTSQEMQERLIQFAVDTSNILERLPQNYMTNHMSKQLFRSTTSIALNYAESNAAESRKDLRGPLIIDFSQKTRIRNKMRGIFFRNSLSYWEINVTKSD